MYAATTPINGSKIHYDLQASNYRYPMSLRVGSEMLWSEDGCFAFVCGEKARRRANLGHGLVILGFH